MNENIRFRTGWDREYDTWRDFVSAMLNTWAEYNNFFCMYSLQLIPEMYYYTCVKKLGTRERQEDN